MFCVFDRVCAEPSVANDNHADGAADKPGSVERKVNEANKDVPSDAETFKCMENIHKKADIAETASLKDDANGCEEKKGDSTSATNDKTEVEVPDESEHKSKLKHDSKAKCSDKSENCAGKDSKMETPEGVPNDMDKKSDKVAEKSDADKKSDSDNKSGKVTEKSDSRENDECSKKVDSPKPAVNGVANEKAAKAGVNNGNSDSDKENGDCPMDLSTGNKPASESSADVIMLSDDDMDMGSEAMTVELTPQQLKERRHLVKRLKEELRNEDAKLVLLKKIRQSQLMQHLHDAVPGTAKNKQVAQRHQAQSVPPPLVRSGLQQQQPAHKVNAAHSNASVQMMRGPAHAGTHVRSVPSAHAQQGPPPLIMAPRHSAPNATPMGILGLRGLSTNSQQNLMSSFRQQVAPPVVPEQTPAQRQAAAKLALRKQLEKTLLQIPPPKPPPPEMNFMPSLSGNEFIMLAGLEEVVKHIVDIDARARGERRPEVKYIFNPFVCVQCGTDFTPVWKRDKPGSKSVICELCVTTNQKNALKQEHTNRLKSAFVKALQQEQEIEQRIQVPSSAVTAPTTTHHAVAHTTTPMNLSTSFKPTSEQMRYHQNLIQAHQAQLRSGGAAMAAAFNPRMAFPFAAGALTKADLQRQYLLDMIPRSMPGGTVLRRT